MSDLFERAVKRVEKACVTYEVHAAHCDTCGGRTGAFCADGTEALREQDPAVEAAVEMVCALGEQAQRLTTLVDRAQWNAQREVHGDLYGRDQAS